MTANLMRLSILVILIVLTLPLSAEVVEQVKWENGLFGYLLTAHERLTRYNDDLAPFQDRSSADFMVIQTIRGQDLAKAEESLMSLMHLLSIAATCSCNADPVWTAVAYYMASLNASADHIADGLPFFENKLAGAEAQNLKIYLRKVAATVKQAVPAEYQKTVKDHIIMLKTDD